MQSNHVTSCHRLKLIAHRHYSLMKQPNGELDVCRLLNRTKSTWEKTRTQTLANWMRSFGDNPKPWSTVKNGRRLTLNRKRIVLFRIRNKYSRKSHALATLVTWNKKPIRVVLRPSRINRNLPKSTRVKVFLDTPVKTWKGCI